MGGTDPYQDGLALQQRIAQAQQQSRMMQGMGAAQGGLFGGLLGQQSGLSCTGQSQSIQNIFNTSAIDSVASKKRIKVKCQENYRDELQDETDDWLEGVLV